MKIAHSEKCLILQHGLEILVNFYQYNIFFCVWKYRVLNRISVIFGNFWFISSIWRYLQLRFVPNATLSKNQAPDPTPEPNRILRWILRWNLRWNLCVRIHIGSDGGFGLKFRQRFRPCFRRRFRKRFRRRFRRRFQCRILLGSGVEPEPDFSIGKKNNTMDNTSNKTNKTLGSVQEWIYTRATWAAAQGGKNEGLCAFFIKILKYKISILKS